MSTEVFGFLIVISLMCYLIISMTLMITKERKKSETYRDIIEGWRKSYLNLLDKHGEYNTPDPIVTRVQEKMAGRSRFGINKYKVGLDRKDLSILEWLNHAQEESMGLCGYLEVLIQRADELKEVKL